MRVVAYLHLLQVYIAPVDKEDLLKQLDALLSGSISEDFPIMAPALAKASFLPLTCLPIPRSALTRHTHRHRASNVELLMPAMQHQQLCPLRAASELVTMQLRAAGGGG